MTEIATHTTDIISRIVWHRQEIRRLKAKLPNNDWPLIAKTCAAIIGIPVEALHFRSRLPALVDFRRIVAHEMSKNGYSTRAIAKAMLLDRKSIRYYLHSYPDLIRYDSRFREKATRCAVAVQDILQQ